MRKIAFTATLLLGALAGPPAQAQTVPTRAALEACHAGGAPLERFAVFSAQMESVPGTKRMQIRFDLLQRVTGSDFRRVQASGLGVWRSSVPGIDIFRYRKQVANLQAPGAYRAIVRFRWLGATGVIQHATRKTHTCRQPDLRADLALGDVTAEPAGRPDRARYTLIVRNDGRSTTPGFSVALAVGEQQQPAQAVEPLAPGGKRVLTFVGPRCDDRTPLHVSLDPGLVVDESDEGDNARTVACPLAG